MCAFCCRLLQGAEDAERYYVVALDVGRRGIVYGGQDGVVEYLCCCVRSGSTHSTLVQRPHAPAAMFFFFFLPLRIWYGRGASFCECRERCAFRLRINSFSTSRMKETARPSVSPRTRSREKPLRLCSGGGICCAYSTIDVRAEGRGGTSSCLWRYSQHVPY